MRASLCRNCGNAAPLRFPIERAIKRVLSLFLSWCKIIFDEICGHKGQIVLQAQCDLSKYLATYMYYTTQVPKLVSRQFEDEVILANFETGIYYSLTGTGADIWLGLRSGATVQEIVTAFLTLDGADVKDVEQSITSFIEQLLAEKIIIPQEQRLDVTSWSPQFTVSFSQPVLERFDDLRELLFLDPVHDVSEAGWPVRAKDGI